MATCDWLGIDFQNVDQAIPVGLFDGELDVHQAADLKGLGQRIRRLLDLFDDTFRQVIRRQHASRIARVDTCFFDVFHHAANKRQLSVGNGIDIDFDSIFQELVDQDRPIG